MSLCSSLLGNFWVLTHSMGCSSKPLIILDVTSPPFCHLTANEDRILGTLLDTSQLYKLSSGTGQELF